ncbi:MAG: nucleoside monophosphate kinase [Phycisphaerae bacterium]|nr:nucleoside monophosphate kinase [Phycisphaerae bacterium]
MSNTAKYKAVLLFGYPGCGKGTQGEVLNGMPNLLHLAMGDIFRALDKQSDIGKEFLSYSTKGLLVPDELTVRVWKLHAEKLATAGTLRPGYHVLLLDGIPRTPSQVELLRELIEVLRVIHLCIEDQEILVKRLKGRALKSNRPDDADESVIRKRIEVYEAETTPVLNTLDSQLISKINADQPPLAVLRDIAEVLVSAVPGKI